MQTEYQKSQEDRNYPTSLRGKNVRMELANGKLTSGKLTGFQDYRNRTFLILETHGSTSIINLDHVVVIEEKDQS